MQVAFHLDAVFAADDEGRQGERERHVAGRFGGGSVDTEVLQQPVAGGDGVVVGAHASMLR